MKYKFLVALSVLLISAALCIFFFISKHDTKINTNKKELLTKIDQLFKTKKTITDGQKFEVSGFRDGNKYLLLSGGFSIYELSNESGGYVKTYYTAGNISYKESEYSYSFGYRFSNHRPSIEDTYNKAYEYLVFGGDVNKKDSYTDNSYTEIKDFPQGYNSDFFIVDQTIHPTEFYDTSNTTGRVFNSIWEVGYKVEKTYYKLYPRDKAIKKDLIFSIIISCIIALIFSIATYFVMKFIDRSPKELKNILNKPWRNIENNSIITFEQSLFGKYNVTYVENNLSKKGTAKFTEMGKLLQIFLPNTVIYYEIHSIEELKLELTNLSTREISKFEKLGSDAYSNSKI